MFSLESVKVFHTRNLSVCGTREELAGPLDGGCGDRHRAQGEPSTLLLGSACRLQQ